VFILNPDGFDLEPMLKERYPQGRLENGSLNPSRDIFHAYFTE
jgi:hypothetical protein